MKKATHSKCSNCDIMLPVHKLTVCDHCLRKFCDEHIYVGIETGNYHLKNFCEECIELLGLVPQQKSGESKSISTNLASNNGNSSEENKQINLSLLKKRKIEVEHSQSPKEENLTNEFLINEKANNEKRVKWEYKYVFLAIDSDIEVDEQMLSHIVKNYLNVFPICKQKTQKEGMINIEKLNKLGEEGWEIITSIPKSKSIILVRKNNKPETTVSANISGAYILLKRKKI